MATTLCCPAFVQLCHSSILIVFVTLLFRSLFCTSQTVILKQPKELNLSSHSMFIATGHWGEQVFRRGLAECMEARPIGSS